MPKPLQGTSGDSTAQVARPGLEVRKLTRSSVAPWSSPAVERAGALRAHLLVLASSTNQHTCRALIRRSQRASARRMARQVVVPDSTEGIFMAVKELQPMITGLQLSRVKLATLRQYFIARMQLLRWLVEDQLVARSREPLDVPLTSRIQCLWEYGAPRALAQ